MTSCTKLASSAQEWLAFAVLIRRGCMENSGLRGLHTEEAIHKVGVVEGVSEPCCHWGVEPWSLAGVEYWPWGGTLVIGFRRCVEPWAQGWSTGHRGFGRSITITTSTQIHKQI